MKNALSNSRGRLGRVGIGEFFVFDSGGFDMEVNAVKEGAGDTLPIALHLCWRAAAFAFWIAVKAAWAGIHCCHQHKGAWEGHCT